MSDPGTYLGRPPEHWAEMLASDDPLDRRLAAHALGEIGRGAGEAVGALTAVAQSDPEPFVRVWAAAGLARVDPDHEQVVPALVAACGAEQAFVRSLAAWALGRLGRVGGEEERSRAALGRLADDEDASVRAEAAHALERIAPRP